jgi:hypothetical protein
MDGKGGQRFQNGSEMILENGLTVLMPGGLNLDANANDYDSECD